MEMDTNDQQFDQTLTSPVSFSLPPPLSQQLSSNFPTSTYPNEHAFYTVRLPYRITTHFPYQPYDSQKLLMHHIVNAVVKAENALLESHTGSGKTTAMICSVLAGVHFLNQPPSPPLSDDFFGDRPVDTQILLSPASHTSQSTPQDFPGNNSPTVFLATKTHAQISQLLREINKCNVPDLSVAVLSSRKHTCVNDAVLASDDINKACRKLTSWLKPTVEPRNNPNSGLCPYYGHSFEQKLKEVAQDIHRNSYHLSLPPIANIEDLKTFGRNHCICPFYLVKHTFKSADIVLCPYSYLISPDIRKAMRISLRNNIVLFDEAHNVPEVGRSEVSWAVDSCTLQQCGASEALSADDMPDYCVYNTVCSFRILLREAVDKIRLTIWTEVTKSFGCPFERRKIAAARPQTVLSTLFGQKMICFVERNLHISKDDIEFLYKTLMSDDVVPLFATTCDKFADDDDPLADVVPNACANLIRSLHNVFCFPNDMALAISMKLR